MFYLNKRTIFILCIAILSVVIAVKQFFVLRNQVYNEALAQALTN